MRIHKNTFITCGLFVAFFGAGVQASDLKSAFLRTLEPHSAIALGKSEIDRQVAREALSKSVLKPQLKLSVLKGSIEQRIFSPVTHFDRNTNLVVASQSLIDAESMPLTAVECRRLPELGLSATHEESIIGSNNRQIADTTTTIAGLILTIPLYRGGSVSAERNEKASLMARPESDRQVTRRFLLRSLEEAVVQFTNAKKSAVSEIANVRSQVMAMNVLTLAFDREVTSHAGLLDAYDRLANAKISRDKAVLSGLLNWLSVGNLAESFEPEDLTVIDSVVAQYQS